MNRVMKVVASGTRHLVLSVRAALAATLVGTGGDDSMSGPAVRVSDAARGANTVPRRSRLSALLAIAAVVVTAAVLALMMWVGPLARGGIGAEDANPRAAAGSAVVHDDAGNVHTTIAPGYATIHDDAGNVHHVAGVRSAIIHDDAGNVHPDTGAGSVVTQ